MTTPHPFAALVRRLDAEASKAPAWMCGGPVSLRAFKRFPSLGDAMWEIGPLKDPPHFTQDGIAAARHESDARLIVTLRNAAPEVAALVEAVEAYRVATDAREAIDSVEAEWPEMRGEVVRLCTNETNAYRAMLSALDALAAKAKEAK